MPLSPRSACRRSTLQTLHIFRGINDGCPPNISSVTTDHDESANSPHQREAGSLITNGRSLTMRTMFHPGLPARAAPLMMVAADAGDRIRRT